MKQSRFADERIIAILRQYRGVRRLGRAAAPADIIDLLSIASSLNSRSYGIVWRVCLARC
jgi:hypothetical protein